MKYKAKIKYNNDKDNYNIKAFVDNEWIILGRRVDNIGFIAKSFNTIEETKEFIKNSEHLEE